MEFTLTYQGPLPPKQRGVSPVKAGLRQVFHPQIKAALERRLSEPLRPMLTTDVDGHKFVSPASAALAIAAELSIMLLTPPIQRIGDADNRLKTLIDGLTCPANTEQLQSHADPEDGGPTYCLLGDDRLVQRVNLDTRRWHGAGDDPTASLVIVTAKLVLSPQATVNSPVNSLFMVL